MHVATPTGLEPATSAVTGRRANQLRYGAWTRKPGGRAPNGIRTRATALKGRRPGPLDDGGGKPHHASPAEEPHQHKGRGDRTPPPRDACALDCTPDGRMIMLPRQGAGQQTDPQQPQEVLDAPRFWAACRAAAGRPRRAGPR